MESCRTQPPDPLNTTLEKGKPRLLIPWLAADPLNVVVEARAVKMPAVLTQLLATEIPKLLAVISKVPADRARLSLTVNAPAAVNVAAPLMTRLR